MENLLRSIFFFFAGACGTIMFKYFINSKCSLLTTIAGLSKRGFFFFGGGGRGVVQSSV